MPNIKEIDLVSNLLLELKKGNMDAFDALYELTYKPLYALCYSYLKDNLDSEDALYDSYLKAIKDLKRFKGVDGFNWLYTICKNTSINLAKKKARVILIDAENQMLDLKTEDFNSSNELFEIAKEILKPKELEIVILHAINGVKLIEISKNLNINEATLRWQYNNALSKLRTELERRKFNGK